MLISAPSVYETQPLSDGRKIGRACLISCCHFSFLTSQLWIVPFPVLCQVSCAFSPGHFLMSCVTLSWPSIHSWGCYKPGTRARSWELHLLLLLHLQDSNRLFGFCSGAAAACRGWSLFRLLSHAPLVLVFPVYTPAFYFGMGLWNLCHLSPLRMDAFRSVLQIWLAYSISCREEMDVRRGIQGGLVKLTRCLRRISFQVHFLIRQCSKAVDSAINLLIELLVSRVRYHIFTELGN